jgi:Spy/CpxP family protein refolding chaperone
MFGFIFGTACLFGLAKVVRGGRGCGHGYGHHAHGFEGGYGHECHHGGRGFRRAGGRWAQSDRGGGFWLRGLFERLDTTPGQEKVIKQAVSELLGAGNAMRGEWDESRRDIASAVRAGNVDEVQLGELFARQDAKLAEVRKTAMDALAKVNEALDEGQRQVLADLIERRMGGFRGWGGPYRQPQGPSSDSQA